MPVLYRKSDLIILANAAVGEQEHVIVADKVRHTPEDVAQYFAHEAEKLPPNGIIVQPILFNHEDGKLISYTDPTQYPHGCPEGKYDHGTVMFFLKGGNGFPDRLLYADSEKKGLPREFRAEMEATFPGISIEESMILQQPSTNKVDCGPNLIRNIAAVAAAAKKGEEIGVHNFTVPTEADIRLQRIEDASVIAEHNAALKKSREAKKAAKEKEESKPYIGVLERVLYGEDGKAGLYGNGGTGGLYGLVNKDNVTPDTLTQIMMGYIPEQRAGFPPVYTPTSLMAQFALDWIEMAFGVKTPGIPSFSALSPKNSFAFRASTLTAKLEGEKWAFEDSWGPVADVFVKKIKSDVAEYEATRQAAIDAGKKADRAAELREARKAAAEARKAGMEPSTGGPDKRPSAPPAGVEPSAPELPTGSKKLGGSTSMVDRVAASRLKTTGVGGPAGA